MKKQKTSKGDLKAQKEEKKAPKETQDKQDGTIKNKKHVTLKEFFEYLLAGYLALLPFFLILIGLLLALLIIFLAL